MTTPDGRTGGSRTGSPSDSIVAAASTVAVVGEGASVSTAKSSRSKRRRRRKSNDVSSEVFHGLGRAGEDQACERWAACADAIDSEFQVVHTLEGAYKICEVCADDFTERLLIEDLA